MPTCLLFVHATHNQRIHKDKVDGQGVADHSATNLRTYEVRLDGRHPRSQIRAQPASILREIDPRVREVINEEVADQSTTSLSAHKNRLFQTTKMNNAPEDNAPQHPICPTEDAMSQQSEETSLARQLAARDQQIQNLTQQLAERDEQVASLTSQLEEEQFQRAQDQAETDAHFQEINDIMVDQQAADAKWRADLAELRKRQNEIEAMHTHTSAFRAGIDEEIMPEKTEKTENVKKEKTWGVRDDFHRADKKQRIKEYIKLRLHPLFGDG